MTPKEWAYPRETHHAEVGLSTEERLKIFF
jgi:hypothetical protein